MAVGILPASMVSGSRVFFTPRQCTSARYPRSVARPRRPSRATNSCAKSSASPAGASSSGHSGWPSRPSPTLQPQLTQHPSTPAPAPILGTRRPRQRFVAPTAPPPTAACPEHARSPSAGHHAPNAAAPARPTPHRPWHPIVLHRSGSFRVRTYPLVPLIERSPHPTEQPGPHPRITHAGHGSISTMPLIPPCRFPAVQVLPAPVGPIMTGSGPDQEPDGLAAGGVPGSWTRPCGRAGAHARQDGLERLRLVVTRIARAAPTNSAIEATSVPDRAAVGRGCLAVVYYLTAEELSTSAHEPEAATHRKPPARSDPPAHQPRDGLFGPRSRSCWSANLPCGTASDSVCSPRWTSASPCATRSPG